MRYMLFSMQRSRFQLAALGLAAFSVMLLGAHHTTAPSPKPLATATPIPAFTATPEPAKAAVPPSVVVYQFETTGEMPKNISSSIAQLFDQQLTVGGLHVIMPPNGIVRSNYLTNAHASKADYYISGYLTPLGDGAAMVVQVVTADTGIMIFSKTAQIFSTNDAAAQADAAREMMLAHSGQLAQYDQAPPTATPQPDSTQGASTSLGGLFGIFKHGSKSSNSGIAPAVANQDKPDRIAIIARVGGGGIDTGTLTSATQSLSGAMSRYFRTQVDRSNSSDIPPNADAICGSNRNATIAGGTLGQQHSHGKAQSTFTLRIYTCFGAVIYEGDPVTGGSAQEAIDQAVSTYATQNPSNS